MDETQSPPDPASQGPSAARVSDRTPPGISDKGLQRKEERTQRQAEALRANLQRRKAQLRARQDVAAIEAGVVEAEDDPVGGN